MLSTTSGTLCFEASAANFLKLGTNPCGFAIDSIYIAFVLSSISFSKSSILCGSANLISMPNLVNWFAKRVCVPP